jgi:hypothetical protein
MSCCDFYLWSLWCGSSSGSKRLFKKMSSIIRCFRFILFYYISVFCFRNCGVEVCIIDGISIYFDLFVCSFISVPKGLWNESPHFEVSDSDSGSETAMCRVFFHTPTCAGKDRVDCRTKFSIIPALLFVILLIVK